MLPKLPEHLGAFAAKYNLTADDIWQIPKSSNFAVKHKALERVAAAEKIVFEPPMVITSDYSSVGIAICVTGHLGKASEWSIGEASKDNYDRSQRANAGYQKLYPWAMAEKRAKDRVILKLVGLHGDLYSEAELEGEIQNGATGPDNYIGGEMKANGNGKPLWTSSRSREGFGKFDKQLITFTSLDALDDWYEEIKYERERFDQQHQDWLLYNFILHAMKIAESHKALNGFLKKYAEAVDGLPDDKANDLIEKSAAALAELRKVATLGAG